MRSRSIIVSFLLVFLFLQFNGFSQNSAGGITVSVKNRSLSELLNLVSEKYQLRFAFNEDVFSQIQTTLSFKEAPLDEFLEDICFQFGLRQKLIGGTHVFYIDDELKLIEAINVGVHIVDTITEPVAPIPEQEIIELTVSGVVKNSKTDEKLAYCKILINGDESISTNAFGYFSTTAVSGDVFNVFIKHLGYHRLDTVLQIENNNLLEFKLDPILYIESKRPVQQVKNIVAMPELPGLIAFNPTTTMQIPAVESNDLVNALTVIPGINYLKGMDTGLSIRGGAPSDNLVIVDGIPMVESSHLMGNLSVLNAKYIQQAFVSRGGFGAEYGGRSSGIVDLNGKTGNNEVPVVDCTLNLLHTNIYVGLPINEKTSLSGSFKKSFVDVWAGYLMRNFALENMSIQLDGMDEAVADVDQTIVNYTDANLKLSMRPSDRSEITVNYFNSNDSQKRDYSYNTDGGFFQQNNSNYAINGYSINYIDQRRNGWMNRFSVGYNRLNESAEYYYSKDEERKDQIVKSYYDTEDIQLSEFRANWKSEVKQRVLTHKFGLGLTANTVNNLYQDKEKTVVGANNYNDSISSMGNIRLANAYYQLHLSPMRGVVLRGGVRSLYNLNTEQLELQPRYGLEINPVRPLKLHYSGGRYLQHMYLAYRIDSYRNASSMWFIPDAVNQNIDAFHHVVGSRLEFNNFLLNIEAYQKTNKDKVYFLGQTVIEGDLTRYEYSKYSGIELNRGVDFFLQYQTKAFKHLISYSLSESFETIDGVNQSVSFHSFDDQLHRLRLTEIMNYRGWTASVNWYFATGTPYLLSSSTNEQFNFERHNNFMQLDLALVRQFNFKNFYADLGVTVLNVLNKTNVIQTKNIRVPEGVEMHNYTTSTIATSFSPLFYINFRYE